MNGKELLEMLNKMSEEELLNTQYDLIGFDLNEVNYCYEAIKEYELYDGKNYDAEFAKMSDEEKMKLIKEAFESKDGYIYRNDYIYQIGEILRDKIFERISK